MKIKIDRELFLDKLNKAVKFVPSKSLFPALENFKLTVTSGTMEIIATDGNIQCKVFCPIESGSDGAICLPAKLLVKTISLFKENEVVITQKDTKVEIKCGKNKYNITMDAFAKDYPELPMKATNSEITMQQAYLKMALKYAEKFVNEDAMDMNFVAINIAEINNRMVFTGLDKTAMCRCSVPPISISKWETINIPTETANKVMSLLGDKGEVFVVHHGDKIMFFTDKDSPEMFEVRSVTANVKFPNSEMLFGKPREHSVVINTEEFKAAARRLSLYSGETGNMIRMSNPDNPSELILTAVDTLTHKDGEETISIVNSAGEPLKKVIIGDNLIKILSGIEQQEFIFYYSGNYKIPCFIEPKVETEGEKFFMFLMATANDAEPNGN